MIRFLYQKEGVFMIKKKFSEVAEMCNGTLINGRSNLIIKGVSIDTRNIQRGNLFIPIVGERFDAHAFVPEAIAKGAVLSLWNKKNDYSCISTPLILVDDTLLALQQLASRYRDELRLLVIGITGSNGKTSTKDILSEILSMNYRVQKTIGNLNNEIGVPLTLLSLNKRSDIAVIEMGMSEKGEIRTLTQMVKPDVAIITSIGKAHFANLGSEEAIVMAKLEILEGLKKDGLLLINGDNQLLKDNVHCMKISQDVITFGQKCSNYYNYSNVIQNKYSIEFNLDKLTSQTIIVPVLGIHQASNTSAAIIVARYLGMNMRDILRGIENVRISQKRNEVIQVKQCTIINDSYKSNPESLMASLATLVKLPSNFIKVAVLGDMRDLGVDEILYHKEIGESIDPEKIQYLYTFGDNSKFFINTKVYDSNHSKHFKNMDELENTLKSFINTDSVMLIKGAHCLNMNKIVEDLRKEVI